MTTKASIVGFGWDQGNLDKNYIKHGVTPNEAEEVFLDENLKTHPDTKHSVYEERLVAIGKTSRGKLLTIIYTRREPNIRVVSARTADKKERIAYEEEA